MELRYTDIVGTQVSCKVTGFKGTVTGIAEYMNGCVRVQIQPSGLKENGGTIDAEWMDSAQLAFESKPSFFEGVKAKMATGGPRDDAPGW